MLVKKKKWNLFGFFFFVNMIGKYIWWSFVYMGSLFVKYKVKILMKIIKYGLKEDIK